jgi:phage shock protein PspC (stress-responsive transcriptional regulator)
MKNKPSLTLSPYIIVLFRIVAIIVAGLIAATSLYACPACEKAQPRIFRGIVHGVGPESRWDYIIVLAAVIITILTLFYSIKWLIYPGEASTNHIKHFILKQD